ncbi:MAG: leucine-rich repeat protein [Lachnospiraceae bacterium]|nr:leucine-rich repeat protein [Lachnospiraceae bacterium]
MEKEIVYPEGSLVFDEKDGELALSRVTGSFSVLTVPDASDDGKPVTTVLKKAFLGKRTLKKIILPDYVRSIGDFCFAHCINLSEVVLPSCNAGEGIFTGCRSLQKISLPGLSEDKKVLLAGAVRNGAPAHLSDIEKIEDDFLSKWDAWAISVLQAPDDEGFLNQILCGEEDYGSSDKGAYESSRRVLKASLSMLRLLNPEALTDKASDIFKNYVYDHRMGATAGNESWIAVRDLYPDKKHFDLLADLNCIDDTNRDAMIRQLGDDKQELKSLLVKSSGEEASDRFFSALEL